MSADPSEALSWPKSGHAGPYGDRVIHHQSAHQPQQRNTTDSTITSTTVSSGCTGKVTGGTSNATLTTTGPANCNAAPPAGTVIAKATFSETWSNGKTSSGTVKLKSTGSATTDKVATKITSGFGFLAGHITRGSTTIELRLRTFT